MDTEFGDYIRTLREQRRESDSRFSVRQVAARIDVEPSYLSKVERGQVAPPSEATIKRLGEVLDTDPDVLLALAGKLSTDLKEIICKRPQLFAQLIREIRDLPDHAVVKLVREVRDGNW
jgi:transcriptional regulator with XRE-family HTH domain